MHWGPARLRRSARYVDSESAAAQKGVEANFGYKIDVRGVPVGGQSYLERSTEETEQKSQIVIYAPKIAI